MKYLSLIWAGLFRSKARTIFTFLSVAVAFLLFGLLQGIDSGLKTIASDLRINRVYTNSKYTVGDGLPLAHARRIAEIRGITNVTHWTYFGGYFQDKHNAVAAFATDVEEMFRAYPEIKMPAGQLENMRRLRTGAVVEHKLALRYGWKVGDRVPLGTSIWVTKDGRSSYEFDIAGIYVVEESTAIPKEGFFFHYDYLDERRSFRNGVVHYFIAKVDDSRAAVDAAKDIDEGFANSRDETLTQTEQAFAQASARQVADLGLIVKSVVGSVLFTLFFLIVNTMSQSLDERMPEVGALKAMGFKDGIVFALFILESLILCLAAAALGLLISAVAFAVIGDRLGIAAMPGSTISYALGIATTLALATALLPALRAKRLLVVECLKVR